MVEHVATSDSLTEAFAWLATAAAVGAALGAVIGGSLVATLAPIAAFVFAGGAGLVALLTSTLRRQTLPGSVAPRAASAAPAAASG
jgi:hypothetical protein